MEFREEEAAAGGDAGAAGEGEGGLRQAQAEEGAGGGLHEGEARPRPEAWSIGGLLKVCFLCTEVVWPRSPLPDTPSEKQSTSGPLKVFIFPTSHCRWGPDRRMLCGNRGGGHRWRPSRSWRGARVVSVKPRPRKGRGGAAGSMEERLPRRLAVKRVPYLRAFEGVLLFLS